MKCPKCGHPSFSAGSLYTVVDKPGYKHSRQRRVCSNPKCKHHFKNDVIMDASNAHSPPDPPDAA